jgi:hypothetical protein
MSLISSTYTGSTYLRTSYLEVVIGEEREGQKNRTSLLSPHESIQGRKVGLGWDLCLLWLKNVKFRTLSGKYPGI